MTLKSWVALSAIALALTSCATVPQMAGQPIENMIAKYGPPHEERTIAGHRYIVWKRAVAWEGSRLECELVTEVDGASKIVASSFVGQRGACDAFG
jgi:hypothetical protein